MGNENFHPNIGVDGNIMFSDLEIMEYPLMGISWNNRSF